MDNSAERKPMEKIILTGYDQNVIRVTEKINPQNCAGCWSLSTALHPPAHIEIGEATF